MKKLSLISVMLFLIIWQTAFAKDTTITLQNGLNGYAGCEDTYLHKGYYDTLLNTINYSTDTSLYVFFGDNGR